MLLLIKEGYSIRTVHVAVQLEMVGKQLFVLNHCCSLCSVCRQMLQSRVDYKACMTQRPWMTSPVNSINAKLIMYNTRTVWDAWVFNYVALDFKFAWQVLDFVEWVWSWDQPGADSNPITPVCVRISAVALVTRISRCWSFLTSSFYSSSHYQRDHK